jgi:hypothetical protein
MEMTDFGFRFTDVALLPKLALRNETDRERAVSLLETTAHRCLVSRCISARVRLEHLVTISAAAA